MSCWVFCRTGRGRKPNDPEGFKVKMNGRFQEAAWIMHKNRVVAHKATIQDGGHDSSGGSQDSPIPSHHRDAFLRDQDAISLPTDCNPANHPSSISHGSNGNMSHHQPHHGSSSLGTSHRAKRLKTASSGSERDESDDSHHVGLDLVVSDSHEASGPFFMEEMKFDDDHHHHGRTIQLPRTGWRCPGVVPDFFYQANAELVHAFSKYYVGSYRVNVVRDIRSDKYVCPLEVSISS